MQETNRIVREIPARFSATLQPIAKRLVVCAYARVSTEKEEQEDSFERQVDHYTTYINNRSDWDFGGIYADPGITGTRAEKRLEFMRMIEDCKARKVDKILVKSVSRFARNTVDALNYIRELKEIGISIVFESENIDTLTPGGEVLLTILAAMAEQESRNISTNIKWAYQRKFKNGDIALNYTRFLGYTRDKNHKLIIVPEESKIVKRIYREYLSGYSTSQIARNLMNDGTKTICDCDKWYARTILNILTNEKYKGDNLAGKSFKPDVLSPKRIKNEGQAPSYYYENSHEPIISKENFEMVQAEVLKRNTMRGQAESGVGKYSSKYPFSTILICDGCGSRLRRHGHYHGGEMVPKWVCIRHQHMADECGKLPIKEETIKQLYLKSLKEIVCNVESFETIVTTNIETSLDDTIANELQELCKEIDDRQDEMLQLNRDKRSARISEIEYIEQGSKLGEEIDRLQDIKNSLQAKTDSVRLAKHRMEEIMEVLKSSKIDDFDNDIFKSIVDGIKVISPTEIEIEYRCGVTTRHKL